MGRGALGPEVRAQYPRVTIGGDEKPQTVGAELADLTAWTLISCEIGDFCAGEDEAHACGSVFMLFVVVAFFVAVVEHGITLKRVTEK
ncbi:MAG: hypothetical protein A3K04_02375 [Gallionellales bacterium RBG_16_56_9]|nr:MAG: hypothetical protein A3K04_02375 [Gallionellales bacterium RBG_16_56_9]